VRPSPILSASRRATNYSAAAVDDAVKKLFATGLFSDVDVSVSGSTLVVTVSELSIVNQVVFRGNRKQKTIA
jgi:outer membrane protein insertion porin family